MYDEIRLYLVLVDIYIADLKKMSVYCLFFQFYFPKRFFISVAIGNFAVRKLYIISS